PPRPRDQLPERVGRLGMVGVRTKQVAELRVRQSGRTVHGQRDNELGLSRQQRSGLPVDRELAQHADAQAGRRLGPNGFGLRDGPFRSRWWLWSKWLWSRRLGGGS